MRSATGSSANAGEASAAEAMIASPAANVLVAMLLPAPGWAKPRNIGAILAKGLGLQT